MQLGKFIDFSKYKRFFAFGCSFTDYKWPMWPELISHYIPNYYNFGLAGCDNQMIFNRVMEIDSTYNFTSDDLVIVMWTNVWRETIFNPDINGEYIRKKDRDFSTSQINLMFRDFCFFKSIYYLLEHKNIDYDFLSISGYNYSLFLKHHLMKKNSKELDQVSKLIHYFNTPLSLFKPSMFETVYEKDWCIKNKNFAYYDFDDEYGELVIDNHPTPSMTLEFLESTYPINSFSKCYDYVEKYQGIIEKKSIHERIFPVQPNNHLMATKTIMKFYPLKHET